MAEMLCSAPETMTTSLIGDTPVYNLKKFFLKQKRLPVWRGYSPRSLWVCLCPNGKGTITVCEESQNGSGLGSLLFS